MVNINFFGVFDIAQLLKVNVILFDTKIRRKTPQHWLRIAHYPFSVPGYWII
jgi:hypothetical protein